MEGYTPMNNSKLKSKRVIAMSLTALFLSHQTMMLSVFASNITNVTNGGHGTFNINPAGSKNGIGYRTYDNFSLDQGDVANLNFKDGNTDINS